MSEQIRDGENVKAKYTCVLRHFFHLLLVPVLLLLIYTWYTRYIMLEAGTGTRITLHYIYIISNNVNAVLTV